MPSLTTMAMQAAEQGWLPDPLVRFGIRRFCAQRLREADTNDWLEAQARLRRFRKRMCESPVALHSEQANEQHYEVPAEFFARVLGKHLKYSCCYWPVGVNTLDEAEAAALDETCRHAEIADGMDILELGCGWGSLSLWLAERYPRARITAVSGSHGQRAFIEAQAAQRGLGNLRVITCDMNDFDTAQNFDRVVSVEMFEHMRNHEELLRRIAAWLRRDGKLFVHIFCHRRAAYTFDAVGDDDWMARHFFTGGMMPSDDLLPGYPRHLQVEQQWRWGGLHYQRTAEAWLGNLDAARAEVLPLLARCHGAAAAQLWLQRWRLFFLGCAEMFGYRRGQEWWVSHYLFGKR